MAGIELMRFCDAALPADKCLVWNGCVCVCVCVCV